MNHEEVVRAQELVVGDRLAGADEPTSYEEALVDAVDAAGRIPIQGDGVVAEAYRITLAYRVAPTRDELLALVQALTGEGAVELSTAQRVWAWQAQRGALR